MGSFDLVRRRRRSYERALASYRQAIVAELDRGTSYATLARALGVSRQSVRQIAVRTRASA